MKTKFDRMLPNLEKWYGLNSSITVAFKLMWLSFKGGGKTTWNDIIEYYERKKRRK